MGALTSIRKCNENQPTEFPLCSSSNKKPKFFLPFLNHITNAALKINQYPKSAKLERDAHRRLSELGLGSSPNSSLRVNPYPKTTKLARKVHLPCGHSKFGFGSSLSNGDKGVIEFRYRKAKNDAYDTIVNLDLKRYSKDKNQALGDPIVESLKGLDGKELVSYMSDAKSWEMELDVHKELLDSAEKRREKSQMISFFRKLHEANHAIFRLLRPKKKLEDLAKEAFVPLTKEESAAVDQAFSSCNSRKIIADHENSNIEITGEILQCLKLRAWLNDEVINLYFSLLKEREKREPKKFLKCHFFNTFFYKKLLSGGNAYDFQSVKRWTAHKKLGYCLFDCDKIFVPIHQEMHWCLAVINKKDGKFQYLDSLRGLDTQVMPLLAKYYVDEVKDKSGRDIDVSSWKQEYVQDLPAQKNGFDCGMFMIKYADFYSRDVGLCFQQKDMPYFRRRTAKEILRLKAD